MKSCFYDNTMYGKGTYILLLIPKDLVTQMTKKVWAGEKKK